MLGIGTGELLVIVAVILIVFGPKRIPELARYIGKATKMFHEASRELQRQLEVSDWDKEPPKKKKNMASPPVATTTYDSESSPYDQPTPYDTKGSETYGDYENPYGYGSEWESKSETETVESGKAAETDEETVDPAKVEDAQRAARELQD